jgi:hypothetical protein
MAMNEQEANEAIAAAMREIEDLRRTGKLDEARKKGWAPLEAIYGSSTDTLTQWVYAEGLAGRSLQGREELQRREAERATSRLLMVAWLTLAVSAIALAVSIIAIFRS